MSRRPTPPRLPWQGSASRAGGPPDLDRDAELAAIQAELLGLAREAADPQPLDDTALPALLAEIRRRVLQLAEREEAAATALRAAVAGAAG